MMETTPWTGASTAAPGLGAGFGSAYGLPYGTPQFAPQGFFGNLLGQIAQPIGQTIGGFFGQPQTGAHVGQMVGGFARFLPFNTMPIGMPYAYGATIPQGYDQLSSASMPMPQSYGPQFAPQGFFGNVLGQIAQPIGNAIGGFFGQPQIGQQVGGFFGGLAQRYLPFEASPMGYPMSPQPMQSQFQPQFQPQLQSQFQPQFQSQQAVPVPFYGQQVTPQVFWSLNQGPSFAGAGFGYPTVMQPYPIASQFSQPQGGIPVTGYPVAGPPSFGGQQPMAGSSVH